VPRGRLRVRGYPVRLLSKNLLAVPNLGVDLWTEFLCTDGR